MCTQCKEYTSIEVVKGKVYCVYILSTVEPPISDPLR